MKKFLLHQFLFWLIIFTGYLAFVSLGMIVGFSASMIFQELGWIRQWGESKPLYYSIPLFILSLIMILLLFRRLWRTRQQMAFFWKMLFAPCTVLVILIEGLDQDRCLLVIHRAIKRALVRRFWWPA